MNPEHFQLVDEVAQVVASTYARRFHPHVQRDDVLQEIYVWALQHQTKVSHWIDDTDDDGREAGRLLGRAMQDAALRYCQQEKAARLGYRLDDLAYYSRGEVKELLPSMFDVDAWTNPPKNPGERAAKKPAAEGNGWLATLADVSRAFDVLSAEDRDLLTRVYRDDESMVRIGDESGVSRQVVAKRVERAVNRLVNVLGGPRPRGGHYPDEHGECECGWGHPGARKAMSGAHARALTSSSYDGEDS